MKSVTELWHNRTINGGVREWAPMGRPIRVRSSHLSKPAELSFNLDSLGNLHWLWVNSHTPFHGRLPKHTMLKIVFGRGFLLINPRAISGQRILLELATPLGRDVEILLPEEEEAGHVPALLH